MKVLTSFTLEENAVIEVANKITREGMDDLYAMSNDVEKSNIFFNLQFIFISVKASGDRKLAAHIGYIISYYLFVLLTPPHSEEIALYYANEAVELANKEEKYVEWVDFVKEGN
ncbi:MAG: hypothetical protein II433_09500 [Acidaminococcaceae bacterium]|nr:hypothetical protein [Acidaminococcaceae bacterium]